MLSAMSGTRVEHCGKGQKTLTDRIGRKREVSQEVFKESRGASHVLCMMQWDLSHVAGDSQAGITYGRGRSRSGQCTHMCCQMTS